MILLLLFCVVILVVLLYKRIKGERKHQAIIQDLSMYELSEFMKKNSIDGSISSVARIFSDILRKTFKCEYIIFLRKKRGMLELNYYHGIKAFNRNDFKLDYSNELMKVLKEDFFPRDVSAIQKFLPPKFKSKIEQFKMDKYFPVFWRDNLYGFYVIKGNAETNSNSFHLVITQLAQSLAAAYHIKWHESKIEQLSMRSSQNRMETKVADNDKPVERVLSLLKNKKTDAIIPQIIKSLQETSQVDDLVFMYDTKDSSDTELLHTGKQPKGIEKPKSDELRIVAESLKNKSIVSLDELNKMTTSKMPWLQSLKKAHLTSITTIPLSNSRNGLLVWRQNGDSSIVSSRINTYKKYLIDVYENVAAMETLEELSFTDNLTSLSNRRYFFKRLHEELSRAERYNRKLALIMFDIDELKNINDTYGHQAGDGIIRQVGAILKTSIRTIDVVARYGGDEFCIIMPEADEDTCFKFVERLRRKIMNSTFMLDHAQESVSCTISIGISIYPDHATESEKFIYAADMALLKAKEAGRNRSLMAIKPTKID